MSRQAAQRRSSDRYFINVRENWYRDVWLIIITGLALLGIWLAMRSINRVQDGRSQAVRITCAVLTAISQAGHDVIAGPGNAPETPFIRQLEKLGYPPRNIRRHQALVAADAYAQNINRHVVQAVGAQRAHGVVSPNGQINCQRLLSLARAR